MNVFYAALAEVHATFQPEKRQASDKPAPSSSLGPQQVSDASSDSSATQGADLCDCNGTKTENESSTVPPVPKVDTGVMVDSKPSTLEEPVVTDSADEGSAHSVDPSWNSCTMPVACSTPCSATGNNSREESNTASYSLTASSGEESISASTSPTIGSRQESITASSSPTAVSSREQQITECQEVKETTTEIQTNSQEANPKRCIDNTASFKDSAARISSETDVLPTPTALEQQKAELLLADAPPTPTASEQQRAELLFSYLQRTSAAGSVHQQSTCSSPSSVNGSGSLLDYAGYLHI